MQKVILRLNRIEVRREYSQISAEFQPQDTLLFETELDENQFRKNEEGQIVLNQIGLSEIVKSATIALYFTTEKEDF